MCSVFVSTIDFASQSETHPWHQSWQKMYWQFHFLTDRQQALFSHSVFYHIYSKTLNQFCFPCAVTKIQALTTISMRASWCVTPARAQTEQFTAQRPTNKRFHIYPPPSLGQLRSWMESRVLGGGGSQGSIGEPVLGTLCCRISCSCCFLGVLWWNQDGFEILFVLSISLSLLICHNIQWLSWFPDPKEFTMLKRVALLRGWRHSWHVAFTGSRNHWWPVIMVSLY